MMIKLHAAAPIGRWAGAAALAMTLLAACGGGGGGGSSPPPPPVNTAPAVAFTLSGIVEAGGSGFDAASSVGSELVIDAGASKDAEGDAVSFKWSIVSKPAASALTLGAETAGKQSFRPDAAGTWVLAVRVSDSKGAFTDKQATLLVRPNAAPLASIAVSASYAAQSSTKATEALSVGASVLLDATGSLDADGDAVSTAWTLVAKPAGSAAALVGDGPVTRLLADVAGVFKVRARGTDARGAVSETVYVFEAQNRAPRVDSLLVREAFAGQSHTGASETLTIGSAIVFDGSGSTDADGDALQVAWTVLERPAASGASISATGQYSARLVLDVPGVFKVRARGTDPSGAYADSIHLFEAKNNAPNTIVLASASGTPVQSGQSTVTTAAGYIVALNGWAIGDPFGGGVRITYAWTLVSKPASSAAALSNGAGFNTQLTPDVLGDYVVRLTATDALGASATYVTTVKAVNHRPLAAITTANTSPLARPSAATLRLPPNTLMTLRGNASVDADGDALTYAWSIISKPAGSAAAVSSATSTNVQVNFDLPGSYVVKLRVEDGQAAFSEQNLTIDVGNYAPVVVLGQKRMSVFQGVPASVSAALSFDEEGDALSYNWAIDARPAGSVATIAAPGAATLAFTPDLPGTYVVSVTVSDATGSSNASVTIRALASQSASFELPFVPRYTRYSKSVDKLVALASGPDALKIVDAFTGVTQSVALAHAPVALNLSANGRQAAVLGAGRLSVVNLDDATLAFSGPVSSDRSDVFLTDNGLAYLIGNNSSNPATPAFTVINTRTGIDETYSLSWVSRAYSGSLQGVFSSVLNRGLFWTSSSYINFFDVQAGSGAIYMASFGGTSPSGIHAPYFLSGGEALLFTGSGEYFHTDSLFHAGQLGGLSNEIVHVDHSAEQEELLVLSSGLLPAPNVGPGGVAAKYKRYTGNAFALQADVALPLVGGVQTYGLAVYQNTGGNHIAVVQDVNGRPYAAGARYYVVVR